MNVSRRSLLGFAGITAISGGLTACGSGFGDSGPANPAEPTDGATGAGPVSLTALVAANAGSPDLAALQVAADAWAEATGNSLELQPASDMNQQLSQGFAAGNPPDLFWVDASLFQTYAQGGYLHPYGDELDVEFYEPLRRAFTYDGTFYGAPKDFSTLGLVINTDLWDAAGLTEDDIPETWEELHEIARRTTQGDVQGLVIGDTRDRLGAFMVQAGGWFTNEDQTEMTADSPENVEALAFVKEMLADGSAKYPSQVDSGWGGEAIGKGRTVMTIEGNWIKGALTQDYPDINWRVAELPQGPAGKGTLTFTQAWGIAAQSENQAAALDFIVSIYTDEQQIEFANVAGVMPSLVTARERYAEQVDETQRAWLAGADYAQGPVSAPGMNPVMADFDTQIQGLPAADPAQILATTQANGEAVLSR